MKTYDDFCTDGKLKFTPKVLNNIALQLAEFSDTINCVNADNAQKMIRILRTRIAPLYSTIRDMLPPEGKYASYIVSGENFDRWDIKAIEVIIERYDNRSAVDVQPFLNVIKLDTTCQIELITRNQFWLASCDGAFTETKQKIWISERNYLPRKSKQTWEQFCKLCERQVATAIRIHDELHRL